MGFDKKIRAALLRAAWPKKETPGKYENPTNEENAYKLPNIVYQGDALEYYSVYRYDWLDEIGFAPKGEVVEIGDRIYFTETPFDSYELEAILGLFAEMKGGKSNPNVPVNTNSLYQQAMVITGNLIYDSANLDSLMRMYGIRSINMEQDGEAVAWFASYAFKKFLSFMAGLVKNGSCFVESRQYYTQIYISSCIVGRASMRFDSMFGENNYLPGYIESALFHADNADIKFLLTPPEIGPEGKQGSMRPRAAGAVVNDYMFFLLNADLTDEKLIRILQIFDEISFDPELYVTVNHGFEGADFEWGGAPYDSAILPHKNTIEPVGVFSTFIKDGNAGREAYLYPSDVLYKYATGPGASLYKDPYKTDPEGLFEDERRALSGTYPFASLTSAKCLQKIADDFYRDVIAGTKDAEQDWDAYMDALRANGLDVWNEFFNKLPATNK
ncbi:MAG: hypothetical protein FWF03_00340 [Defluviitaleaceae bacterium]|nr:hypothetical protein [Defluviitaleaceae bacterium]